MAVLPFLSQVSTEAPDGPSSALLGNYGACQNWLEAAMPSMGQPWLKEATPLLPLLCCQNLGKDTECI